MFNVMLLDAYGGYKEVVCRVAEILKGDVIPVLNA